MFGMNRVVGSDWIVQYPCRHTPPTLEAVSIRVCAARLGDRKARNGQHRAVHPHRSSPASGKESSLDMLSLCSKPKLPQTNNLASRTDRWYDGRTLTNITNKSEGPIDSPRGLARPRDNNPCNRGGN